MNLELQTLTWAQKGGELATMEAMVDRCMADYDTNGWTGDTWVG